MPEDIIIEEEINIEEQPLFENNHIIEENIFNQVFAQLNIRFPSILSISEEEKQKSMEVVEEYLAHKNKKIEEMDFYTIYTIISKLSENEQIEFFRENIDYISKNDEEIFLYDSLVPTSLVKYLSLNVLKELHSLDKKIINRIFSGNLENLFCGANVLELYDFFYEEINNMDNIKFINSLSYLNVRQLTSDNDLATYLEKYTSERNSLIYFIYEKYKSKIDTFTAEELSKFIHYVSDLNLYKSIIEEYKAKLITFFETTNSNNILSFFSDQEKEKQEIVLSIFFDYIIKNPLFNEFVHLIDTNVIIKKYKENKKLKLSLNNVIKSSASNKIFNDDLIVLLDEYEINNIEELFDDDFYRNGGWYFRDIRALKYIEQKYRDNIITDGNLFDIDENTSIFSNEYLKNIKEIQKLLKEKLITKDSLIYQKHFKNFVLYLKKHNVINEIDELGEKEIDILFYRIIMNQSMTLLYEIKNINGITIYNRLRCAEVNSNFFTIEQLKKYNVKHHKKLCSIGSYNKMLGLAYRTMILKLMLLVGYKHAKEILEIDNDITTLEHLIGTINISNIKMDEQGNPILNKKIINLLFNSKENTRIKEMLSNKTNDLYTFFPRIFSEWDAIKETGKDKSLNSVLELLKSNDVIIPSKYFRLQDCFKYIGCSNDKVEETFKLHDKILEREETTIPNVFGKVGEYTYEILDLHDMYALTVGNRTNCCFTVKGVSYSSLKHACTSKNGRILVIKKDDELIAHSWLWRNGNLLCLDNIEVNKGIIEINFLDVYLDFADKIINKSSEIEGEESIRNVTIGHTKFDKPIVGIDNYVSLVLENEDRHITKKMKKLNKLPQPIEAAILNNQEMLYTDSKRVQYLIKGNGIFNLGQSKYFYNEKEKQKQKVLVGGKV